MLGTLHYVDDGADPGPGIADAVGQYVALRVRPDHRQERETKYERISDWSFHSRLNIYSATGSC